MMLEFVFNYYLTSNSLTSVLLSPFFCSTHIFISSHFIWQGEVPAFFCPDDKPGLFYDQNRPPFARLTVLRSVLTAYLCAVVLEKQTNAPDRRKRNKNVDYPAYERRRSAEQPCYQVKAEDTDKSPVKAADYQQNQCYFVQHILRPFVIKNVCIRQPLCRLMHKLRPPQRTANLSGRFLSAVIFCAFNADLSKEICGCDFFAYI